MRWFSKYFWSYLLEKPCTVRKFFCRVKGHEKPIWYTSEIDATEPDMRCQNCLDDIG